MADEKQPDTEEMNEGTTEGFDAGVEEGEEGEHMVLTDDDGVDVEFEYIGSVDYEGSEYIVLLPVEDDEDGEAEVLILKVESLGTKVDEDGEEYEDEQYVSVDSEETLDAVFEIFKQDNADLFEFVEE